MKTSILLLIGTVLHVLAFGQKTSWISYFPAQDSIIGQMCIGTQNDMLFSKMPDVKIEYEHYKGYDELSKEQRKSLKFKLNQDLSYSSVRIVDVHAKMFMQIG